MFEKISDPRDIRLVEGYIPLRHRYTPGTGGEPFFRALRDRGELLGSHCERCVLTYCPPRVFCERCFSRLEPDAKVGPKGVVEAFTVGYVGVEGEPLDEPVVLGLVRPDGADTVLVHFLVDYEGRPVAVGDRVEAALLPKNRRTGSILDLRGFRPSRG